MKNKTVRPDKYEQLRKPINRRAAKRYPWLEYKGTVTSVETHKEIKFEPVDVSETGICIISKELFAKGDMLLFIYKQIPVRLEVVWVYGDDEKGVFKYGLTRVNEKQKLHEIFLDKIPEAPEMPKS